MQRLGKVSLLLKGHRFESPDCYLSSLWPGPRYTASMKCVPSHSAHKGLSMQVTGVQQLENLGWYMLCHRLAPLHYNSDIQNGRICCFGICTAKKVSTAKTSHCFLEKKVYELKEAYILQSMSILLL